MTPEQYLRLAEMSEEELKNQIVKMLEHYGVEAIEAAYAEALAKYRAEDADLDAFAADFRSRGEGAL